MARSINNKIGIEQAHPQLEEERAGRSPPVKVVGKLFLFSHPIQVEFIFKKSNKANQPHFVPPCFYGKHQWQPALQ